MKEDILEKIVNVERQIQEKIQKETLRAEEWLKEIRRKAEIDIKKEEDDLRNLLEECTIEAEIESRKEAENLIEKAKAYEKELLSIIDSALKDLLIRHLKKILPSL